MSLITSLQIWNECSTPVQLCLVLTIKYGSLVQQVDLSLLQIKDHVNTALALLSTTLSPQQCHTKSICIYCCNHLDFVQLVTNKALKTFFCSFSFIVSLMFHSSILINFLCLNRSLCDD